jgi:hypothetical protein
MSQPLVFSPSIRLSVTWRARCALETTFTRGAIAKIAARATIAEVAARTTVVAITARAVVTVALLHHRRRTFFVLLDGKRHVAKNVFVDAHLAFHLVHGSCRCVDVHKGVMRLAVLLDAVCEGLEAPVFYAPDFAAICFEDTLVLFYEGINLLCGHILSSKEYVFIKSHVSFAFLAVVLSPGFGG